MTKPLAILVMMLLAACASDSTEPKQPQSAVVSMPAFSFVPFTTTIRTGGTVTYDFPAEPHNVIFEAVAGAPADIPATSNRSVVRTFSVAGTFPYDCKLHPGMSGVVEVR